MGLWTTVGLNLAATAVQANGNTTAITYASRSTGCGTLASALTAGASYTSLALDATLPVTLAGGVSLTITDGTNSQTVTTSGSTSAGASSIAVTSFVAGNNYAAHTSGVCPTPLSSDIALYNESARVAVLASGAGSGAGESLTSGYFDGTQATGVYLLVGYWGGSTASSTLASGTLMGEDIQYWNHVINADSNMCQADSVI